MHCLWSDKRSVVQAVMLSAGVLVSGHASCVCGGGGGRLRTSSATYWRVARVLQYAVVECRPCEEPCGCHDLWVGCIEGVFVVRSNC